MATNPDRPQFQDTIDEAWGQSVADHVIRRYPDAAARDADLADFAAAELAGQVVAIGPAAGPISLWMHNGAGWVLATMLAARYYRNAAFVCQAAGVGAFLDSKNYDDFGTIFAGNALTLPYAGLWRVSYQTTATTNNQWVAVWLADGGARLVFAASATPMNTWATARCDLTARFPAGKVLAPMQQGSVDIPGQPGSSYCYLEAIYLGP